jgi:NAD-dependent dihydropyrimidine dehydrogenase PreA subunit
MYLRNVTTLELYQEQCTGCGMCTTVCPHGVFRIVNGLAAVVDRDACMECSACLRNCPEGAIFVQSGVGCAQAVINSALGRRNASCCNLDDYRPTQPAGGITDNDCGCGEGPVKSKSSGCC